MFDVLILSFGLAEQQSLPEMLDEIAILVDSIVPLITDDRLVAIYNVHAITFIIIANIDNV